jgi:galactose mutarotase-like enzyme
MITLSNKHLSISVNPMGAELRSITDANNHTEYMWQADPKWWGRSAPVLFPIVGKVKDDTLHVGNDSFKMTQHGFARDFEFVYTKRSAETATLLLTANAKTLERFPYSFTLEIQYTLKDNRVICMWKVTNTDQQEIYFSIGAHPGFNLLHPMHEYHILLHGNQQRIERMMLQNGLFMPDKTPFQSLPIELNQDIFNEDALVFEAHNITGADLAHTRSAHSVKMRWQNFDYLGLWAPKGCEQFVCIEPWCGRADDANGHTDIKTKPGIHVLQPGRVFERWYSMEFTC